MHKPPWMVSIAECLVIPWKGQWASWHIIAGIWSF